MYLYADNLNSCVSYLFPHEMFWNASTTNTSFYKNALLTFLQGRNAYCVREYSLVRMKFNSSIMPMTFPSISLDILIVQYTVAKPYKMVTRIKKKRFSKLCFRAFFDLFHHWNIPDNFNCFVTDGHRMDLHTDMIVEVVV